MPYLVRPVLPTGRMRDHSQPVLRVAAKAGFTAEGTLRSALLHADGWHDMHLHARVLGDPGGDPDPEVAPGPGPAGP